MNLIVFDIDDTLTKSEAQHQQSYLTALKSLGIQSINEDWKSYMHLTDSYILKVNYEEQLKQDFEVSLIDTFEKEMLMVLQNLDPVSEVVGAGRLIQFLQHETDYAITFATGSLYQPAIMKLSQSGIWFEKKLLASSNRFFSREEIVNDAIKKARAFYQVDHFERIISIGDGIWDMKTAGNLGLKFIGVGTRYQHYFREAQLPIHTIDWLDFDFKQAEKILYS